MMGAMPIRWILLSVAVTPAIMLAPTHQGATRVLDRPDIELEEPFTNVGSVRELRDGRVILVDNGDRVVRVVDFAAGTSEQIGRQGSGPGEYRVPGVLLPLAGDSTLLTDAGNRRLLLLAPDGRPAAIVSDGWPLPNGSPGTRLPRAIDARGRGYLLGSTANVEPSGAITQLDSAPLLRVARGNVAEETLGHVRLAPRRIATQGANGKLTSVSITIPPYPAQDAWQVFADGAVALVRVRDYRVDWVLPDGRRVVGPALQAAPIRITQRDRDEWVARSGRGRAAAAPPAADWPEFKPPFPSSGVLAGSDGRVWVERHAPAGETRTRYDVVDRRGNIAMKVEVPNNGRIVGFGPGSIYVVRKDADDLQYLQRFTLSKN
jgi:hypothetical protein